ncbi:uncharacterized protein LOC116943511 isoform X1 [Petromyzon marinus]|uniref:uncharacterized protein LOC116943511 isoform X1 n=1 Tax=Petromyzon marinus TaxID=7757 RepID=UPI003F719A25
MAPKRYVSSGANVTSSSCLATTSDLSMKMQRKSMRFPHSPVLIGNFTEELCQLGSFSSAIANTTCQSGDQIPMENAKPQAKQPRRRSTLSQAFLNSKKRSIKSEFTGNSSIETRDEEIIKVVELQAKGLWDTQFRGMISPKVVVNMPLENPRRRLSNVKRIEALPFVPLENVEEAAPNCDSNLLLCREFNAKPLPDIDEALRLISGRTEQVGNCLISPALVDLIPSPPVVPSQPVHLVPTQRTPRVLRSRPAIASRTGAVPLARPQSPPRPPRPAQQRVAQNTVAKSNPDKATIKSNSSRQLQMTRNPSTPPQNNSGAKMQQERPTSEEDRRLQLKGWLLAQRKSYRRPPMSEEAPITRVSARKMAG